MVGSAFIVTELQYNIGNAAIPQTLTSTFIMSVGAVGPTLGSFNATSMIFLALLPTIPWVLLHRSPLNILMSFFLVAQPCLASGFSGNSFPPKRRQESVWISVSSYDSKDRFRDS